MGRSPCCSKERLNRGAWTATEDKILSDYKKVYGEGKWRNLPKKAGLKRCGKSCRLRWLNYLRPDIKRGNITQDEEDLIIRLHKLLGNRWSLIAGRLPGRTDNEIKNYWNTNISKRIDGKSSTQCRGSETISRIDQQAMMQQLPSEISDSRARSANSSRCTKVFVNNNTEPPPKVIAQQQQQQLEVTKTVVGPSSIKELVNDTAVQLQPSQQLHDVVPSVPFICREDHEVSHFMVDMDMDLKFFADFFSEDYSPMCDFDDAGTRKMLQGIRRL